MNRTTTFLLGSLVVAVGILIALVVVRTSGHTEEGAAPAAYSTSVDEPKANALFHEARGHLACREGCPADFVLVATCDDGARVFAPPGLYVRGRRDTGGYEHRKTDPTPIVVPLSYDWCAK